jgi:hypothetical protein
MMDARRRKSTAGAAPEPPSPPAPANARPQEGSGKPVNQRTQTRRASDVSISNGPEKNVVYFCCFCCKIFGCFQQKYQRGTTARLSGICITQTVWLMLM